MAERRAQVGLVISPTLGEVELDRKVYLGPISGPMLTDVGPRLHQCWHAAWEVKGIEYALFSLHRSADHAIKRESVFCWCTTKLHLSISVMDVTL